MFAWMRQRRQLLTYIGFATVAVLIILFQDDVRRVVVNEPEVQCKDVKDAVCKTPANGEQSKNFGKNGSQSKDGAGSLGRGVDVSGGPPSGQPSPGEPGSPGAPGPPGPPGSPGPSPPGPSPNNGGPVQQITEGVGEAVEGVGNGVDQAVCNLTPQFCRP
jgi:hypothetical protein